MVSKAWVPLELGGIKTILEAQTGVTGYNQYPFEDVRFYGNWNWGNYNSSTYGSHQALRLDDVDLFNIKSGGVHLRAAKDYKIRMLVYTQNYDYFPDYVKDASLLERIDNALGDSFIVFTLDGSTDDYLSIDIDQEHSGVANFNLRLGGEFAFQSSPRINDEVDVVILGVESYEDLDDPLTDEEREEKAREDVDDDDTLPFNNGGGNGGGGGGGAGTEEKTSLDYLLIVVLVGVIVAGSMGMTL